MRFLDRCIDANPGLFRARCLSLLGSRIADDIKALLRLHRLGKLFGIRIGNLFLLSKILECPDNLIAHLRVISLNDHLV